MSGRSSNSNEDTGRAKKKGGGFLARQSKAKKTITEEELLKKDTVTPDDVLKLTKCTESKLKVVIFCSQGNPLANYQIVAKVAEQEFFADLKLHCRLCAKYFSLLSVIYRLPLRTWCKYIQHRFYQV